MLASFLKFRGAPRSDATPEPGQAAASAATAPAPEVSEAGAGEPGVAHLIDLLEQDLRRAQVRTTEIGRQVQDAATRSVGIVRSIHGETEELAHQTGEAEASTARVATALEELVRENATIAERTAHSTRLLGSAETLADGATREMDALKGAIGEIEDVLSLIADIAGQTNLLALNATIEAARAGEAGRGFSVVASEVKALSVETRKATDRIADTIAGLKGRAETAMSSVRDIIGVVEGIRPVFSQVDQAVAIQAETAREINHSAEETARFAKSVADRATVISRSAAEAVEAGLRSEAATEDMNRGMADVSRQMLTMLRQTAAGDRRQHDRWPVAIRGTLTVGARSLGIATVDLSQGGALVRATGGEGGVGAGGGARLALDGIGTFSARIVAVSPIGIHIAFERPGPAETEALARRIAALAQDSQADIEAAQEGARRVGEAFDAALASGRLTAANLFDTDYRQIAGTDPVQFETRYLAVLDEILPPILEDLLQRNGRFAFCAAVDLNGYLPVHNRKFSHPQRKGDPVWNAANSRNRRIFDDRAGLSAARNTRPFLVQSYQRDLGGGKLIMMKEVDAPIRCAGGRHWGGFRTAMTLQS